MVLFQTTALEMQNRELQKSVSDMEKMVLDVNCINSKLHDENKFLKERLAKESEKCNDLACHLDPVETALSQASQEVVELKKQLVSFYTFVNESLLKNIFVVGNNKVD
jgi:regulator of replication initiation timing